MLTCQIANITSVPSCTSGEPVTRKITYKREGLTGKHWEGTMPIPEYGMVTTTLNMCDSHANYALNEIQHRGWEFVSDTPISDNPENPGHTTSKERR
ncbi:hypothetical protein HY407_04545 [Candidatus Gottesmanbacteria bacterium]|nr:hypothetical protein [Candidatus Gottesmanbacteria bacterium]